MHESGKNVAGPKLGSYHILNTDPVFKSYGENAEFFGKPEKSASLLNDNEKDPFMRKLQGSNNIVSSGASLNLSPNMVLGYPNPQYGQSINSNSNNAIPNSNYNNNNIQTNSSNYLQSGFMNSLVLSGLNSGNENVISSPKLGGIFRNITNSNSQCTNCKRYEDNERLFLIMMNDMGNLLNDITDKEKLWRQGKINFEYDDIGPFSKIIFIIFLNRLG